MRCSGWLFGAALAAALAGCGSSGDPADDTGDNAPVEGDGAGDGPTDGEEPDDRGEATGEVVLPDAADADGDGGPDATDVDGGPEAADVDAGPDALPDAGPDAPDGEEDTAVADEASDVPIDVDPGDDGSVPDVPDEASDGAETADGDAADVADVTDTADVPDVPPPPRRLYYTENAAIRRCNLDGSSPETVVATTHSWIEGLAADGAGGRIYWVQTWTGEVWSARRDGTDARVVVDTPDPNTGVAVDSGAGQLYWVLGSLFGSPGLYRSALDGTGVVEVGAFTDPAALALDPARGRVYLGRGGAARIQRARLDGTDVQSSSTLGSGNPSLVELALDPAGGHVYWLALRNMEGTTSTVERGTYDPGATTFSVGPAAVLVTGEPLVSGLPLEWQPEAVAFDGWGRRLYWAMKRGSEVELWWSAPDGSGPARILVTTTSGSAMALAVVEE
jgi:hypothetical protein